MHFLNNVLGGLWPFLPSLKSYLIVLPETILKFAELHLEQGVWLEEFKPVDHERDYSELSQLTLSLCLMI